jgi:hypothetical protein
MNIKLSEWNELIKYGNELCDNLKERGYDVRLKPYTMYDGRKGLAMQVFDSFGNFFKEYYSGVDTYEFMKNAMYMNEQRIMTEC